MILVQLYRTWLSNLMYNNSKNWDIGRVPCEADRVVVQKSEGEGVVLQLTEGKTSLRALVLPSYSEIVLPKDGIVQFYSKKISPSCDGQDAVYKHTKALLWTDPKNWDGWNKATPDLERVPCTTEAAYFPGSASYNVLTPDNVRIGVIKLSETVMYGYNWLRFANEARGFGAQQFHKADGSTADIDVTGALCHKNEWCECNNDYLRSDICVAACPVPICKDPVTPAGFCCPICGVYFLLESDLKNLRKENLRKIIGNFLRGKDVVWHVSRVKEFLQLVLVESSEYKGEVPKTAEDLNNILMNSNLGLTTKQFFTSGHVWYPTSFGEVAGHFFSLMFFAAFVITAIVVFYSQHWTWLSFAPLEGRPFVFARFENQTGEVHMTDREEIQQSPVLPQAFDNPMYGSTGQEQRNVTVENPIYTELEEGANSSTNPLEESDVESTDFTKYNLNN